MQCFNHDGQLYLFSFASTVPAMICKLQMLTIHRCQIVIKRLTEYKTSIDKNDRVEHRSSTAMFWKILFDKCLTSFYFKNDKLKRISCLEVDCIKTKCSHKNFVNKWYRAVLKLFHWKIINGNGSGDIVENTYSMPDFHFKINLNCLSAS